MNDKSTSERLHDSGESFQGTLSPHAVRTKPQRITDDQLTAAAKVRECSMRQLNRRSQAQHH
jgi:hypothetical protein